MEKIKVLLVEDEQTLTSIIKDTLDGNEFEICLAFNGQEGIEKYQEVRPDIIVSDIMMPDMDGFTMVRRIRQLNQQIPVLFLSARSAANDVVEGFESGGNDYLKKPFGMAELVIRVKALLHRISIQKKETAVFQIGNYLFDPVKQTLIFQHEKIVLSNRESEILKRLCDHKEQVLPMKEVLLELWGGRLFL